MEKSLSFKDKLKMFQKEAHGSKKTNTKENFDKIKGIEKKESVPPIKNIKMETSTKLNFDKIKGIEKKEPAPSKNKMEGTKIEIKNLCPMIAMISAGKTYSQSSF